MQSSTTTIRTHECRQYHCNGHAKPHKSASKYKQKEQECILLPLNTSASDPSALFCGGTSSASGTSSSVDSAKSFISKSVKKASISGHRSGFALNALIFSSSNLDFGGVFLQALLLGMSTAFSEGPTKCNKHVNFFGAINTSASI